MNSTVDAVMSVELVTAVKSSSTSEALVCQLSDGTVYERELSTTFLAGWGRLLVDQFGLAFEPVWVEFGEVGYGMPYMELLFRPHEFDRLEGNADLLATYPEAYARWKALHRVPTDAAELYYIVPPSRSTLDGFVWS